MMRSVESDGMSDLCNIIELWHIVAFKVFQNGFNNWNGQSGHFGWFNKNNPAPVLGEATTAPTISSLFKQRTSTGRTISNLLEDLFNLAKLPTASSQHCFPL